MNAKLMPILLTRADRMVETFQLWSSFDPGLSRTSSMHTIQNLTSFFFKNLIIVWPVSVMIKLLLLLLHCPLPHSIIFSLFLVFVYFSQIWKWLPYYFTLPTHDFLNYVPWQGRFGNGNGSFTFHRTPSRSYLARFIDFPSSTFLQVSRLSRSHLL